MSDAPAPRVAIVDYGMGNLFSVKNACAQAGMSAAITSRREDGVAADVVILPGIGAFGDAMRALADLDLVSVLRDVAAAGKPLLGICLGMQLFMTESHEFGRHRGLGIVDGEVVRLPERPEGRRLKVPHVGWSRIRPPAAAGLGEVPAWSEPLLGAVPTGDFMYFVHSFYCLPADAGAVVTLTSYGPTEFCSGLRAGNVVGFQFHPERSGSSGLRIYANLAASLHTTWESGNGRTAGSEIRTA